MATIDIGNDKCNIYDKWYCKWASFSMDKHLTFWRICRYSIFNSQNIEKCKTDPIKR
jgi:hypothetical protein